jgi:hypothetical protein
MILSYRVLTMKGPNFIIQAFKMKGPNFEDILKMGIRFPGVKGILLITEFQIID